MKKIKKEFNYGLLKLRIKSKVGKKQDLAKKLGCTKETISVRLNNRAELSQSKIVELCELLDIEKEDIPKYFFNEKVK